MQQLQGLFLRPGILGESAGLDEPGPGWIIRAAPSLGDVPAVAERVEVFSPAWGKSVVGFPGGKLHPRADKVQFMVSGVGVTGP